MNKDAVLCRTNILAKRVLAMPKGKIFVVEKNNNTAWTRHRLVIVDSIGEDVKDVAVGDVVMLSIDCSVLAQYDNMDEIIIKEENIDAIVRDIDIITLKEARIYD